MVAFTIGMFLVGVVLGQSPHFLNIPSGSNWPFYLSSWIVLAFVGLALIGVLTGPDSKTNRIVRLIGFVVSWTPFAFALVIYFADKRSGWRVEFWPDGLFVLLFACVGFVTVSLSVAYLFYTAPSTIVRRPGAIATSVPGVAVIIVALLPVIVDPCKFATHFLYSHRFA